MYLSRYPLQRCHKVNIVCTKVSFDQINDAISLNHTRSQWVDLGILTEACITRPETCGALGGAVAFWMRIDYNVEEGEYRGIISSADSDEDQKFIIYCYSDLW